MVAKDVSRIWQRQNSSADGKRWSKNSGTTFSEFAENKRLLWIAEEWHALCRPQLAEWAMEHLVNRRDVWSQYTLKNGESAS